MKKILIILFLLIGSFSFAQRAKIDSLLQLVATPKEDTLTARRYNALSFYYNLLGSDSALFYGNKGVALAQKLHWLTGEARTHTNLYYYFYRKENSPKALTHALNSLKIYEKLRDTIKMIDCINSIGFFYNGEEDYERYIKYSRQANILAKLINHKRWIETTLYNIGSGYASLKIADSALVYFQESYVYAMQDTTIFKDIGFSFTFSGLGRTQLLLKNYSLALSNFQMSLAHTLLAPKNLQQNQVPDVLLNLSITFDRIGQNDSALFYAERSLAAANEIGMSSLKLKAYSQLANLYMGKENNRAVQYFKLAADLRDSLFTSKRKAEMSSLTYNEEERQRDLLKQQQEELIARKKNLQYAAIALGLVIFIILFLLFSHSIIANQKLIRFLGIIALLIVFEFLNLFLHPYLDKLTDHSPVLMLAAMVCIAALLVPLHHKLEHWITNRMVEKNKKIRLAAAKKTIAKLEPTSTNLSSETLAKDETSSGKEEQTN